jgi:hypothetical protein
MPAQSDFILVRDAAEERFPDYGATHGLPELIRLVDDSDDSKTKLIVVDRKPFALGATIKHSGNAWADRRALARDAYLLWRLSERYGTEPFGLGLLDKERVQRLWQLGALICSVPQGSEVTSHTEIAVAWGRRRLNGHFEELSARALSSRHAVGAA